MGLIAMALDSAKMNMGKLRIYNAIDNALMTVPVLYLGQPYTVPEMQTRLDHLVRANYELDALNSAKVLTVDVAINTADVTISSSTAVNMWLTPAVFHSGSSVIVQGTTKLRVPRINVAIVLDSSHSMTYPDPFVPSQSKLETALGLTVQLGKWLRDDFDRVAVMVTSDYSQRLVDFVPTGGFDLAAIQTGLAGLIGAFGSWTNLADGLYEARTNFRSITYPPDDFNVVGLVTDGYVSHGRANFVSLGNPGLDPNTTTFGELDYHFQIEQFACRYNCGTTSAINTVANYTLRMAPLIGNPPWLAQAPSCATVNLVGSNGYGPLYDTTMIPSCLSSLKIHGGDGGIIDLGFLNGLKDGADADKFRELAYLSTIAQADAIRAEGAMIFALGVNSTVAAPLNYLASASNPSRLFSSMGALTSSGFFGETFLRRVALSPKGYSDTPFPQVQTISALLSNPFIEEFRGDYLNAHQNLSQDESLRIMLGRMPFIKEY
jgi:hypothetical protein